MAEADLPEYARFLLEHLSDRETEAQIRQLFLNRTVMRSNDGNNQNESSNRPRNTNAGVQTDPGVEATTYEPWIREIERNLAEFCTELRILLNRFHYLYREETKRYLAEQRLFEKAENRKLEYIAKMSKDKSKQKKQSEDCAPEASSSSVMEDSYALSKIEEIENKLQRLLHIATAFVHRMATNSISETGSDAAVYDSIASEMSALNLNPTTSMPADSQDQTGIKTLCSKSLPFAKESNPIIGKRLFKPQKPKQELARRALNLNPTTWMPVDSQDQTEISLPIADELNPVIGKRLFKPQKPKQEGTKVIGLECDSGPKNFIDETNKPPANMAYMGKCSKQEAASGSSQTKNQGAIPKKTNQNVPKSSSGESSRKTNASKSVTQKPMWR